MSVCGCASRSLRKESAMMMCDLMILIDPKHPDQNTIDEIVAALNSMGGCVVEINAGCHMIEAIVPATELPTLHHLGGVSYVRPVFSYVCPTPAAAATAT